MSVPLLWLLVAILAAIVELVSPLFGFIFAAAAALVAAAAGLGFSLLAQVVVFVATLLLALGLVRPRLLSRLGSPGVPSRTQALIGKPAKVTERIDPATGSGRVVVAGEDWAASSPSPLPAGAAVWVTDADGIVLQVASTDPTRSGAA